MIPSGFMVAGIMGMVLPRNVLPVPLVDELAGVAALVVVAGLIYEYFRWRGAVPSGLWEDVIDNLGWGAVIAVFFKELVNRVILQRDLFNERWRWLAHILTFWGFVGLIATTITADITNHAGNYVPITTPYRVLGNVSGALLLIGSSILLWRMVTPRFRKAHTFGEIWFVALLWLATVSGFVVEYYAEVQNADALAASYIAHFIIIGLLLIMAPFSGFMHAITTPVFRYINRLHESYINITKITPMLPIGGEKTKAILDEVENIIKLYGSQ